MAETWRKADGWAAEIFDLFIEGRLGRLSAGEVCSGVDWIASRQSLLDWIDEVRDDERRCRLAILVSAGAAATRAHAGRAGRGQRHAPAARVGAREETGRPGRRFPGDSDALA